MNCIISNRHGINLTHISAARLQSPLLPLLSLGCELNPYQASTLITTAIIFLLPSPSPPFPSSSSRQFYPYYFPAHAYSKARANSCPLAACTSGRRHLVAVCLLTVGAPFVVFDLPSSFFPLSSSLPRLTLSSLAMFAGFSER